MRLATPIAAAALLAPLTPLLATAGLECASPQRGAPSLYLSVGSGGGVDLVIIGDRGRELRATGLPGANPRLVRESYMDRAGRVSVRIVSGDGRTVIARVVLRNAGAGDLRYRGRAWRISCQWESQD